MCQTSVTHWYTTNITLSQTSVTHWYTTNITLSQTSVTHWYTTNITLSQTSVTHWYTTNITLSQTAVTHWYTPPPPPPLFDVFVTHWNVTKITSFIRLSRTNVPPRRKKNNKKKNPQTNLCQNLSRTDIPQIISFIYLSRTDIPQIISFIYLPCIDIPQIICFIYLSRTDIPHQNMLVEFCKCQQTRRCPGKDGLRLWCGMPVRTCQSRPLALQGLAVIQRLEGRGMAIVVRSDLSKTVSPLNSGKWSTSSHERRASE